MDDDYEAGNTNSKPNIDTKKIAPGGAKKGDFDDDMPLSLNKSSPS